MLIKFRFRFPEVFFGAILTVAIFAMGMLYESSRYPPSQQIAPANTANQNQPQHIDGGLWNWLTHDATGVFTLFLVIVGGIQIAVFLRQLIFIRRSVDEAKAATTTAAAAAAAARESANHLRSAERAHINGGIGGYIVLDVNSLNGPYVFANLNNHGKTPGFVTRIAVAVRPLEGLPDEPEYPDGIRPGFMLGPNERGFAAPAANAWNGGLGRRVFYGRIWYDDMFDPPIHHFSSFILDLDTGYGILDRPEYWRWT